MRSRSASPRAWRLLAIMFAVAGALWLAVALLPHNQDPYIGLRFAIPIIWFAGAVIAAVRAHRAGADNARKRD